MFLDIDVEIQSINRLKTCLVFFEMYTLKVQVPNLNKVNEISVVVSDASTLLLFIYFY